MHACTLACLKPGTSGPERLSRSAKPARPRKVSTICAGGGSSACRQRTARAGRHDAMRCDAMRGDAMRCDARRWRPLRVAGRRAASHAARGAVWSHWPPCGCCGPTGRRPTRRRARSAPAETPSLRECRAAGFSARLALRCGSPRGALGCSRGHGQCEAQGEAFRV